MSGRQRLLRLAGVVLYAAFILLIFGVTAYLSFGQFVRRGVTAVPDLGGLTLVEAENRLAESGLEMSVADAPRYDDDVPPGRVLQQRPRGASLVKRGSEVEVVESLGPAVLEVPELRGVAVAAAQVSLSAAGLTLGRTANVFAAGSARGRVVQQNPPPLQRVGQAAAVDLYVSDEDPTQTYIMPDLVYRDVREVREFFESRGFRVGGVKPEPYEGVAPGVVLRQHPLAGHPLRRQEVISLVVSMQQEDA